jgi:hypothetical protein
MCLGSSTQTGFEKWWSVTFGRIFAFRRASTNSP